MPSKQRRWRCSDHVRVSFLWKSVLEERSRPIKYLDFYFGKYIYFLRNLEKLILSIRAFLCSLLLLLKDEAHPKKKKKRKRRQTKKPPAHKQKHFYRARR